MLLSVFFQNYLIFGSLLMLCLWLYITSQWVRSLRKLMKLSGKDYFSVLAFFRTGPVTDPSLAAAIEAHYIQGRKHLRTWVISLIVFTFITLTLGVLTAGH